MRYQAPVQSPIASGTTMRVWRTHRIAIGLVLFASLTALIVAAMAAGGATGERTYAGKFVDDGDASVRIEVASQEGEASRASFEAIDFQVVCEGQPPRRMSFGPLRTGFVGQRVFEGRDRTLPQNDEFSYLFKFEGRLLGRGRAEGFVFYRDSDTRPPPGENYAECSTNGLLRWKAERVR